MLFLEKTDVKKIGEICEGIANGSRILSAEDVVMLDLFHSRLKSIIGIKVGEIARAFYPATRRKFFELKEFYIIDDTMNVICYDLDAELFTFSFPIKMFDMSKEEIENYTIQLFADQIEKYRKNLEDKKKELEEKEKEVNTLKQKISDLEQACQPKEY
jgi:hypothetical protein